MEYNFSRLVSKTYPQTGDLYDVTYHYGALGDGRNGAGRVVAVHQGADFKIDSLTYDELGHVVVEDMEIQLPDGIRNYTTKYAYDSWGRILSMVYPDLELVSYYYKPVGLLDSITGHISGTALISNLLSNIDYDGFDNITFMRYGNQATSEFSYNPNTRSLASVVVETRISPVPSGIVRDVIMDKTYEYDALDRVNKVENNIDATVQSTIGMGGSYVNEYLYDSFNRLARAKGTFDGTQTYEIEMNYNEAGGITNKHQTVAGGFANNFAYNNAYTYDTHKPHQLVGLANSTSGSGQPFETGFAWNESGSMRAVSARLSEDVGHDTIERFVYNEEQRMMGHVNKQSDQYTHFVYNHAGERILKGSINAASLSTNGQTPALSLTMDPYTLYVNPFYVAVQTTHTDRVSKHYYFNGQRFATKRGFYLHVVDPPGGPIGENSMAKNLGFTMEGLGFEDSISWSMQSTNPPDTNVSHYPRLMYYYHPDYLGHVEYITDLDGVPYQYFYYTPWGEALVEQKNTLPGMVFDSPYRFNGKELDEEPTERSSRTPSKNKTSREQTGLYYYGARYYNPTVSVWLGVDPKAHWYPTMSSYVYTANNPIMYVDPNGQWVEGGGFWNNLFLSDSRVVEKMAKKHAKKIGGEVIPIDGGFRVTGPEITNGNVNNSNLGQVDFTDFYVDRLSGSSPNGGGMPNWASYANTIVNAFMVGNGANTGLFDYAVRTNYKSARTASQFNKLSPTQQAWRTTNTLGKTGAQYLKIAKGLGYVGAGLTTTYSAVNAGSYYYNGGTDWQVGAKATLDVIMTGVGFLGPIGFGISATYFIVDAAGGFGNFGNIKP